MQRILLTGAGGFVGGHLLPALRLAFPHAALTATGHRSAASLQPLDVTDAIAVATLIGQSQPDVVIHLAAITAVPVARRNPDLAWRINLQGTLNVARAILERAPQCLMLFVSSAEVYGGTFRRGEVLDEAATPAPLNTYAATKAAADLALGAMAAEASLRVVRLRAFNHIGPGQSPEFAVSAFARQIARIEAGLQEPVLRVGTLTAMRDFLDVRDVCAAYVACLRRSDEIAAGAVFNIASGQPRRLDDVLQALLALSPVRVSVETAAELMRPVDIPLAAGDAARARALFSWQPQVPWETTLRDTLDDWRTRVAKEER